MNIKAHQNKALTQDLAKFKMAVDNASDIVIITSKVGKVIYANDSAVRITGYSIAEILGKTPGEIWGGYMGRDFYQQMWTTISKDKKIFKAEIRNKKKNGQFYLAELVVSPILNENNDVLFYVATERDITREREISQMKNDFISLASHQLRTPLSAMRWFIEMLLDEDAGKLNQEQQEYLKNIDESNKRLIALVNSLLNISRIESGRIIVDPKLTDLKVLLTDLLVELKPKLVEKKQEVVLKVPQQLPKIEVDPKLVRHVYMNLLTNSMKYSGEKSKIKIVLKVNDKEVISQVEDEGLGIPDKEQTQVFSRFFRATNIVKLETEGTGLGLYLVKAVVESSGGKIWFKSEEGKGTSFWFSLPLAGSQAKKGEVNLSEDTIFEVKKGVESLIKADNNKPVTKLQINKKKQEKKL